jgi:two-component system, NtrC family, sensor kinase
MVTMPVHAPCQSPRVRLHAYEPEVPGRFDPWVIRTRPAAAAARRSMPRHAGYVGVLPAGFGIVRATGPTTGEDMRLTVKLVIALVLGILGVMAVYAWVQISNEVLLSEGDAHRARRNGLAWLGTIESVWEREGEARARELIELSRRRVADDGALRVVPLDDTSGQSELTSDEIRELMTGGVVRRVDRDASGQEWRRVYAAVGTAGRPTALELSDPFDTEQTFVRMSHLMIVGATAAIVVVCALLASVLQVRLVGRPLALLRDKARRVAAGDCSRPLMLRQRDEMGELATEINAMCEAITEANGRASAEAAARIAALEQLRHSERLATVGQLAAGVAHELGTPLNVVSARAELLLAPDVHAADAAANGRIILEQADRMTAIIHQLLDFSRRRGPHMGLANIEQVVAQAVDLVSPAAERAGVTVECSANGPLFACIDGSQMQQVLANVLMNGIQAMPDGGRMRVAVGPRRARPPADRDAPTADYLCVTVEDEGTGIPPEQLARIFEPFFTTKQVGEGTGLGLAVAHGIVAEHGGWIQAESDVGKGSRFSIFLPRPAEPAEAAS